MNGVEILTSAQVVAEWSTNWIVFWIVFGIVFCICLIRGIWDVIVDECWGWVVIPLSALVGILFGSMTGMGAGTFFEIPVDYETQYQVTISDEVPMTEFIEHYEVIDQDGKIFTVREKNNDE